MLDELSAHLADAEAAGRTGQEATGRDVRTFAAAWARARSPLPRRVPRTVCPGAFVLGCLLLLTCLTGLTRWTTESAVTPGNIAFWAVLGAAPVVRELRRGSLACSAAGASARPVRGPARGDPGPPVRRRRRRRRTGQEERHRLKVPRPPAPRARAPGSRLRARAPRPP
ncbi:hypothetical protein ACIRS3_10445 [Streptomyces virginiae]|uniref:hypothetical protein n=1 Tax=Streptomyces virginiae TaxID=1961 RepID=UPI0038125F7F